MHKNPGILMSTVKDAYDTGANVVRSNQDELTFLEASRLGGLLAFSLYLRVQHRRRFPVLFTAA